MNLALNHRDKTAPRKHSRIKEFVVVAHSLSHVQLFLTQWTAASQSSLSFTISWSLLKLMSVESMVPSNYLILCCLVLLLSSIFPSFRVFMGLNKGEQCTDLGNQTNVVWT